MTKIELVFIPSPGLSHLISTVEAAKLLLRRDRRLSATVLLPKLPGGAAAPQFSSDRLRLLDLPALDDGGGEKETAQVREAISDLIEKSAADSSHRLAGLVLDMFCSRFIDVARELGLKSYVFFTSGACSLALSQHLVALRFELNQDLAQFRNSDLEISAPYFASPLPAKVLPETAVCGGGGGDFDFLDYFRRIREADGIVVNTFYDLESHAIDALLKDGKTPRVYPIGPILGEKTQLFAEEDEVKKWLDNQPEKSVIFLCFGTMGSLDQNQVKEIAIALENCGCRFLWSLRKAAEKGAKETAVEYDDVERVLPEGFSVRSRGVGRVIGWAPQVAVLAHEAIGGFVSHCGWNSILESVWFGVPVAAFPLYAEQHLNAFYLGEELGMAEVITLDYKIESRGEGAAAEIVGAGEIEAAIRRLMAEGGGVRREVEEMRRKARAALVEGGTSYNAQNHFIQDFIRNIDM